MKRSEDVDVIRGEGTRSEDVKVRGGGKKGGRKSEGN